MASITIRNLDDDVKTRLRVRAAEHHRSMEEESAVDPARCGWAQAEFAESRERHPLALRTGQRRGPGVAAARARARAAVLRLS